MCVSLDAEPDPVFSEVFANSGAIEIALLVWYHAKDPDTRTTGILALIHFLNSPNYRQMAVRRCLHALPAESTAERCKQVLREAMGPVKVHPAILVVELHLIHIMVREEPTAGGDVFGHTFAKTGIYREALELASYTMSQRVIDWEVMDLISRILWDLMCLVPFTTTIIREYVDLGMLHLIAQILSDKSGSNGKNEWFRFFEMIGHAACCEKLECTCWGRSDASTKVKHALEHDQLWAKTLVKLGQLCKIQAAKSVQDARRKRKEAWLYLGLCLGVKEGLQLRGSDHGLRSSRDQARIRECPFKPTKSFSFFTIILLIVAAVITLLRAIV